MKLPNNIKFLSIVTIIYSLLAIYDLEIISTSLLKFINLLIKILPTLLLTFILIFLFNYFFSNKKIKEYLQASTNLKKYSLAIVLGIISTGPIYVWYPFLSELKQKGLNNGLISIFLYNRAIKPQFMPLMIFYFSFKFVLIITCLIIIFSVLNGIIIKKLLPESKN